MSWIVGFGMAVFESRRNEVLVKGAGDDASMTVYEVGWYETCHDGHCYPDLRRSHVAALIR